MSSSEEIIVVSSSATQFKQARVLGASEERSARPNDEQRILSSHGQPLNSTGFSTPAIDYRTLLAGRGGGVRRLTKKTEQFFDSHPIHGYIPYGGHDWRQRQRDQSTKPQRPKEGEASDTASDDLEFDVVNPFDNLNEKSNAVQKENSVDGSNTGQDMTKDEDVTMQTSNTHGCGVTKKTNRYYEVRDIEWKPTEVEVNNDGSPRAISGEYEERKMKVLLDTLARFMEKRLENTWAQSQYLRSRPDNFDPLSVQREKDTRWYISLGEGPLQDAPPIKEGGRDLDGDAARLAKNIRDCEEGVTKFLDNLLIEEVNDSAKTISTLPPKPDENFHASFHLATREKSKTESLRHSNDDYEKKKEVQNEEFRRENPFLQEMKETELKRLRDKYFAGWRPTSQNILSEPKTGARYDLKKGVVLPTEPKAEFGKIFDLHDSGKEMSPEQKARAFNVICSHLEKETKDPCGQRRPVTTNDEPRPDVAILNSINNATSISNAVANMTNHTNMTPPQKHTLNQSFGLSPRLQDGLRGLASPLKNDLLASRNITPQRKKEVLKRSLDLHLEKNSNELLRSQDVIRMLYGESMEAAEFLDKVVQEHDRIRKEEEAIKKPRAQKLIMTNSLTDFIKEVGEAADGFGHQMDQRTGAARTHDRHDDASNKPVDRVHSGDYAPHEHYPRQNNDPRQNDDFSSPAFSSSFTRSKHCASPNPPYSTPPDPPLDNSEPSPNYSADSDFVSYGDPSAREPGIGILTRNQDLQDIRKYDDMGFPIDSHREDEKHSKPSTKDSLYLEGNHSKKPKPSKLRQPGGRDSGGRKHERSRSGGYKENTMRKKMTEQSEKMRFQQAQREAEELEKRWIGSEDRITSTDRKPPWNRETIFDRRPSSERGLARDRKLSSDRRPSRCRGSSGGRQPSGSRRAPSQKLRSQMTNALKLLQETAFLLTEEGTDEIKNGKSGKRRS